MMTLLTQSPISVYDLGAIGLIFLLAAGILRLLTYVVKNKLGKEPCKTIDTERCPVLCEIREIVKKIDVVGGKIDKIGK